MMGIHSAEYDMSHNHGPESSSSTEERDVEYEVYSSPHPVPVLRIKHENNETSQVSGVNPENPLPLLEKCGVLENPSNIITTIERKDADSAIILSSMTSGGSDFKKRQRLKYGRARDHLKAIESESFPRKTETSQVSTEDQVPQELSQLFGCNKHRRLISKQLAEVHRAHDLATDMKDAAVAAEQEAKLLFEQAKRKLEGATEKKRIAEEKFHQTDDDVYEMEMKESCRWNDMYQELVAFKKKNGHVIIPVNDKNDLSVAKLYKWCVQQTFKITLPESDTDSLKRNPWRIRALNDIGFIWDRNEERWRRRFREFLDFKARFGTTIVPAKWKENPALGAWVVNQQKLYKMVKDGKDVPSMTPERMKMLDDAGFILDRRDAQWHECYNELKEFRLNHGHCHYPFSKTPLSDWMTRQRISYRSLKFGLAGNGKRSKVTKTEKEQEEDKERIRLLDEIGFIWDVRGHKRQRMTEKTSKRANKHPK